MHIRIWLIATDIDCIRIIRTSKFRHHIFWKIDQYRSRSSCSRDIKGFFNNSSKILSVSYNNTVFSNTACNSYNINLLECIISDQWSCYLTCKTYERYTVIIRCCKPCNKVCSSRSACNKTDTYLTRCSGISIRLRNHQSYMLPDSRKWYPRLLPSALLQVICFLKSVSIHIPPFSKKKAPSMTFMPRANIQYLPFTVPVSTARSIHVIT